MENVGSICSALKSLAFMVESSALGTNEKHALMELLNKLAIYFTDRYNEVVTKPSLFAKRKFELLTSKMTDYIVAINDTINGKNDVFCIVNMIYKEINYDKQAGHFKRKRLIR